GIGAASSRSSPTSITSVGTLPSTAGTRSRALSASGGSLRRTSTTMPCCPVLRPPVRFSPHPQPTTLGRPSNWSRHRLTHWARCEAIDLGLPSRGAHRLLHPMRPAAQAAPGARSADPQEWIISAALCTSGVNVTEGGKYLRDRYVRQGQIPRGRARPPREAAVEEDSPEPQLRAREPYPGPGLANAGRKRLWNRERGLEVRDPDLLVVDGHLNGGREDVREI